MQSTAEHSEGKQLNTRTAELAIVRIATYRWLRKHGMRLPAGPLTDQQEMEIEECFEMLDEDGSGALDTDELVKAFNLLGFKANKQLVKALMRQVHAEDKDELQLHEFRTLMAQSVGSQHLPDGQSMQMMSNAVPFEEVVRGARRIRTLQSVMAGGQKRQQIMDKGQTAASNSLSAPTKPARTTPRPRRTTQLPGNPSVTAKLAAHDMNASLHVESSARRSGGAGQEENTEDAVRARDEDDCDKIPRLLEASMTLPWNSSSPHKSRWDLAYHVKS